jgi:hypothetical protein
VALALAFGTDFALRVDFAGFDMRLLTVGTRLAAPLLTLGRVSISSSMLRLTLRHSLAGRGLLAIWPYNRVKNGTSEKINSDQGQKFMCLETDNKLALALEYLNLATTLQRHHQVPNQFSQVQFEIEYFEITALDRKPSNRH